MLKLTSFLMKKWSEKGFTILKTYTLPDKKYNTKPSYILKQFLGTMFLGSKFLYTQKCP